MFEGENGLIPMIPTSTTHWKIELFNGGAGYNTLGVFWGVPQSFMGDNLIYQT
jgi:hypothetical protein